MIVQGRSAEYYDNNTEKRVASYEKTKRSYTEFRSPVLKFFDGEKKSIMELAAICGLVYKDGKVG